MGMSKASSFHLVVFFFFFVSKLLIAELLTNGSECGLSGQPRCQSNYCVAGPENRSFCMDASRQCPQPGTQGIFKRQSYPFNGKLYGCFLTQTETGSAFSLKELSPGDGVENGEPCGANTHCRSGHCYAGPEGGGPRYCIAAEKNCAKPNADGVMYGDTYLFNGKYFRCETSATLTELRANGTPCTENLHCRSGYCYAGPEVDGPRYCIAAEKNCAKPNADGVMFYETYFFQGVLYQCISGGVLRSTEIATIQNGQSCKTSDQCQSNYCYPGPNRENLCIAAEKNCAQPNSNGVMYGDTYLHDGTLYYCDSQLNLKSENISGVRNGQACTEGSQCTTNDCALGPDGKRFCLAREKNCTQPNGSGVMYGESYDYFGTRYGCHNTAGLIPLKDYDGLSCSGKDSDQMVADVGYWKAACAQRGAAIRDYLFSKGGPWEKVKTGLIRGIAENRSGMRNSEPLYGTQTTTQNLMVYAKLCSDTETLNELVGVYLTAYDFLSTDERGNRFWKCGSDGAEKGLPYCPYYWDRNDIPIAQRIKQRWADTDWDLGSSQFIYPLAYLLNAILEIPESTRKRYPAMQEFLRVYPKVLAKDHLMRWISPSDPKDKKPRMICSKEGVYYSYMELLDERLAHWRGADPAVEPVPLHCDIVTDIETWVIAATVELLSAHHKAPQIVTLSPEQANALRTYVRKSYSMVKDRLKVVGSQMQMSFDPNSFYDNYEQYWAGYTKEAGVLTDEEKALAHQNYYFRYTGWDFSHARRLVNLFDSLYRNKCLFKETGTEWVDFPLRTEISRLSSQISTVVFDRRNGDLDTAYRLPRFRNYWSGDNGWYMGTPFVNGTAPFQSSSAFPEGGFGFWSIYNYGIGNLMVKVRAMTLSTDEAVIAHRKKYFGGYWYNNSLHLDDLLNTPRSELLVLPSTLGIPGVQIPPPQSQP